ncbi:hypothetical protein [Azospirillum doebereinerae]
MHSGGLFQMTFSPDHNALGHPLVLGMAGGFA